jgi:hypothetical protein
MKRNKMGRKPIDPKKKRVRVVIFVKQEDIDEYGIDGVRRRALLAIEN